MANRVNRGNRVNIDDNTLTLIKWAGIAAIGYFGVVNPVLKAVGIKKSKNKQLLEKENMQADNNSGWNANYQTTVKEPAKRLTADGAKKAAVLIKNAFGFFNDNEETIFAVFRALRNKYELSQVSAAYATLTGKDLLQTLRNEHWWQSDGLSDADYNIVAEIINKLPNV